MLRRLIGDGSYRQESEKSCRVRIMTERIEIVESNSKLEAARQARGFGLCVIPCKEALLSIPNSGKEPAIRWKDYQTLKSTPEEIARWFTEHPEWNPAVVTGPVSGLDIIDADSAEAVEWVEGNLPYTPYQVLTKSGTHFYYTDTGVRIPNAAKLHGMPLDVRGFGGYAMSFGAEHWTGHIYKLANELSPQMLKEVPPFDLRWLAKEQPQFRGRDISVDPLEDRAKTIRRALGAVMSPRTPDAVAGERGHNRFFSIACLLTHEPPNGFGLSEQEALPILIAYNQAKCHPVFSDKETVHKIKSALERKGTR